MKKLELSLMNSMVQQGRNQKRKQSTRQRFLQKKGLTKVPQGYEIDHKIPLSEGGSDSLRNMRLVKKKNHRSKTRQEAKKRDKQKRGK